MGRKRLDPIQRILDRVKGPLSDDRCWETTGYKNKDGYSMVWVHPTYKASHRLIWEAYNAEPIPEEMVVRHTCDNPCCVNPNHLVLGTHKDNMKDKKDRGGARGVSSKLTEGEVKIIKDRLVNGESPTTIHTDYTHISRAAIYSIKYNKNWWWV